MKNHLNTITTLLALSASVFIFGCEQPKSNATSETDVTVTAAAKPEAKATESKPVTRMVQPAFKDAPMLWPFWGSAALVAIEPSAIGRLRRLGLIYVLIETTKHGCFG